MTEVSHAYMESDNVQATDFRVLRGRAIHIHDELAYADAAAYFGMNSLWDSVSQANHFGTDGSEMTIAEHDTIVLVKQSTDEIIITGMGRAIGHYARFIQRGAKRVDASSSDPLLLVSAFRDDTQGGRLVLVVINNASQDEVINVSVSGAVLAGDLGGEQSTAAAVWQPLAPITPAGASNFSLTVPAESVTTVATAAGAGGAGTGGASGAGGLGSSGTGGTAGVGGVTSGGTGGSAVSLGGAVSSGTAGAVVATGGGTSGNQGNASGGAGAGTSDKGGCGCRLLGRPPASKGAAVLALALALLLLQRRGLRR
jgi:hypothetical protein